jgi:hypothetical protein
MRTEGRGGNLIIIDDPMVMSASKVRPELS